MRELPLRLAILSTPRSGNIWVQHLLSALYHLERLAPNAPPYVSWHTLPPRCVLILHWRPEEQLRGRLRQHGFRWLTLARHPLDVLVSILHFVLHGPTDRWLLGQGGNEEAIVGVGPTSAAFLQYATGPRAAALLSITPAWWVCAEGLKLRYEDLVAHPETELQRLVEALGVRPLRSINEAIAANGLDTIRALHAPAAHHFWQGQPGLWRQVLPAAVARAIAAAHPGPLTQLGYTCDPDPTLSENRAEERWRELTWPGLVADLQQHRLLRTALRDLNTELAALKAENHRLRHQQKLLPA
ncbi:MAG: sulfotransferase [Gemmataceae bacterium]|nr:sulfotransferase [Gemmataceae bacterium]MDW8266806.1 hypothetical protein [Gemmataceae bacterium]